MLNSHGTPRKTVTPFPEIYSMVTCQRVSWEADSHREELQMVEDIREKVSWSESQGKTCVVDCKHIGKHTNS